jgi:hypothetical protein
MFGFETRRHRRGPFQNRQRYNNTVEGKLTDRLVSDTEPQEKLGHRRRDIGTAIALRHRFHMLTVPRYIGKPSRESELLVLGDGHGTNGRS